MEQDGVLPLSHWHWLGVPLDHENAVEPVDKSNSLALTTWIVDQLRKSDKQDVRDFIEGEKVGRSNFSVVSMYELLANIFRISNV